MSESSDRRSSLADQLGADAIELVRLMEADLARHEAVINEHHRTSITIRGFSLSGLAVLVVAGLTSRTVPTEVAAFVLGPLLAFADYYYSRLYASTDQRLKVLAQLSVRYRQLCGRGIRKQEEVDDFLGDLRSFGTGPVVPADKPSLRPIRPLGRFALFLPVYVALVFAAVGSAVVVLVGTSQRTTVDVRLCARFEARLSGHYRLSELSCDRSSDTKAGS